VPLKVGLEAQADGESLVHGALHCTNSDCQCEYPVIDGIPLIVPQVRTFIANNVAHLIARNDLPAAVEAMLGDSCGPGSTLDTTRFHLSSYAWDHYAEFDPEEHAGEPGPGSVVRVLDRGLSLAGAQLSGPLLDAGCSVGRATFELAERCDELVLGVDLNFSMLRLAAGVMRQGVVTYPRRRVGLVFDRRQFRVPFDHSTNVDFWVCDTAALPFPAATFAAAVSLNVLDCVSSPLDMLGSLAKILKPAAPLVLSTPYDWSGVVTVPGAWVGGHSDRAPGGGASEPVLRALLTPGAHPASVKGLRLTGEVEHVPWRVRAHDRSVTTYDIHIVAARAE
jgi:SAM-dependent methyltransferase/uncharacterized protein YbaR (Trm112 family)